MAILKKKGFTAKQSKRTTRKMDNSSIGSHNVRRPTTNQDLRRGSVYGQRRERGGKVSYSGNRVQRRETSKRFVLVIAIIVLVIAVAAFVGITVFRSQASGKIAYKDSAAIAALAKEPEEGPSYALFIADLDSSDGDSGADVILVARIDKENGAVSLISVPNNLQVPLSDAEYHPLKDACTLGGDAALINSVANATNLTISHIMRVDKAGFLKLTDTYGGVDIELSEPLDDPSVGSIYLSPGSHTLTGEQSLVYLKATNFTDGVEARGRNQCAFAASMAEKVFALGKFQFIFALDKNGSCIMTDWSYDELKELEAAFSGLKADAMLTGVVPGYETSKGEKVFISDSSDLARVIAKFEAGEKPAVSDVTGSETVDPGSFTILVKNGSGIAGEATFVKELLESQGFKVTDTANADVFAYEETLVIYKDDKMEAAANAVQKALGFGRVITAGSFYAFDEDIMVMYGGDRKVLSENASPSPSGAQDASGSPSPSPSSEADSPDEPSDGSGEYWDESDDYPYDSSEDPYGYSDEYYGEPYDDSSGQYDDPYGGYDGEYNEGA